MQLILLNHNSLAVAIFIAGNKFLLWLHGLCNKHLAAFFIAILPQKTGFALFVRLCHSAPG